MAADRKAYMERVEAQMHELDDEIETLKRKEREADGEDARAFRHKIDDLEARKAEIDERFRALGDVDEDLWPTHRDEFDASWNRITAAFRIHR